MVGGAVADLQSADVEFAQTLQGDAVEHFERVGMHGDQIRIALLHARLVALDDGHRALQLTAARPRLVLQEQRAVGRNRQVLEARVDGGRRAGGQRGLPPFLVKNPGLNSGFMIPQYTAAGIVSENKQLCTPASVDSIPSSNNQEDHVSMGANAATKCKRVMDNLYKILAIELFTAAQAMEFRRPLKSSPTLESVLAGYRKHVRFNDKDRILHFDMINTVKFLQQQ